MTASRARTLGCAIALTVVLAGCSEPADPAASTSVPPSFPDVRGYAEGKKDSYFVGGTQYAGYSFRTPAGQQCASNSYPSPPDATIVQCWGPRPDQGPGTWKVAVRRSAVATVRQAPSDAGEPKQFPVLPRRHVLKWDAAQLVCGVDDTGAVACRVGEHGFILAADETTLF